MLQSSHVAQKALAMSQVVLLPNCNPHIFKLAVESTQIRWVHSLEDTFPGETYIIRLRSDPNAITLLLSVADLMVRNRTVTAHILRIQLE